MMIGIREYLSIIGEISNSMDLPADKVIADLITIDTVTTHFLQSGILNLVDSNSRNEFITILDKSLELDLHKQLFIELLKREDLLPDLLKELSLITEHLTEIIIDLEQYEQVTDIELNKLLHILQQKHPNRFVIITITMPSGEIITKYINTHNYKDKEHKQMSELDTLLSLYMEVNSGA